MNNHKTIEPIENDEVEIVKLKQETAKRISELVKFHKKFDKFLENEKRKNEKNN